MTNKERLKSNNAGVKAEEYDVKHYGVYTNTLFNVARVLNKVLRFDLLPYGDIFDLDIDPEYEDMPDLSVICTLDATPEMKKAQFNNMMIEFFNNSAPSIIELVTKKLDELDCSIIFNGVDPSILLNDKRYLDEVISLMNDSALMGCIGGNTVSHLNELGDIGINLFNIDDIEKEFEVMYAVNLYMTISMLYAYKYIKAAEQFTVNQLLTRVNVKDEIEQQQEEQYNATKKYIENIVSHICSNKCLMDVSGITTPVSNTAYETLSEQERAAVDMMVEAMKQQQNIA